VSILKTLTDAMSTSLKAKETPCVFWSPYGLS